MFSHNSGQHRSRTLAFELFRFWLRIRGDIRKGFVALCHSFWIYYFLTFIHTIQSHSVHPSPFAEARLLESSSHLRSARGASNETRFELGPALQQADALPTELRRILKSCAASYWAAPHPNWAAPHPTELRRILWAARHSQSKIDSPYRWVWESTTTRIGESGSRRLPVSASRGVGYLNRFLVPWSNAITSGKKFLTFFFNV